MIDLTNGGSKERDRDREKEGGGRERAGEERGGGEEGERECVCECTHKIIGERASMYYNCYCTYIYISLSIYFSYNKMSSFHTGLVTAGCLLVTLDTSFTLALTKRLLSTSERKIKRERERGAVKSCCKMLAYHRVDPLLQSTLT